MPVIVHVRTGTCRHFKDYDLAVLWLRKRADQMKYLFTGPDDFKRVTTNTRMELWPLLKEWSLFRWKEDRVPSIEEFTSKTPEQQNKMLWIVTNNIADKVSVVPSFLESEDTIRVNLERCAELLPLNEWVMIDVKAPELKPRLRKTPRQMQVIMETLLENDEMYITEEDLEILMVSEQMVRRMKTRQSTLRIFRYYRPVLEAAGVLDARQTTD